MRIAAIMEKFFKLIIIFSFAANLSLAGNIAFAQTNTQRVFNREAGETPSKLPVPRFVSLKFRVVNARAGPSPDYPIRWVYRRQGLPVRVIAETEEWRRIEDPDGAKIWVHKRMLDAKRTVITRTNGAQNIPLRREADETSRTIALLNAGVIGEVVGESPGFRRIKIGRVIGWVRTNSLWGAQ